MVRFLHLSDSCIGCGQCEDVCPAEIPLTRLYQRFAVPVQKEYGYLPGMSDRTPPFFALKPEDNEDKKEVAVHADEGREKVCLKRIFKHMSRMRACLRALYQENISENGESSVSVDFRKSSPVNAGKLCRFGLKLPLYYAGPQASSKGAGLWT